MSNTNTNATEYGYIKDGKVFLKGYFNFEDREIGVVKEDNEQSLEYFAKRFETVKAKLEAVEDAINNTENKGSYLMKLIHFKDYLTTYNAIGDFVSLYDFIEGLENDITIYIEKNRKKNTEIKTALVAEMEGLQHSTEWYKTNEKIKEIRDKWIKTGNAYDGVNEELKTRLDNACNHFIDAKKNHQKQQAQDTIKNVYKYKKIIDRLRDINRKGASSFYLPEIQKLEQEWGTIGKVPKMKFNRIFFDYKTETQNFYNTLKFTEEIFKLPPIDAKRELLKISDQILDKGAPYNINSIKQIQGSWKKVGRLAHADDRDLNLKFRICCNEIFESYFLERAAKSENENFPKMKPQDKNRLRIKLIKESIQLDENDLQQFTVKNAVELAFVEQYPGSNYQLVQQRNNFINKIKTKQRILKKLKDDAMV